MPHNSDTPNGVLSDSDYDDALSKLDIATCGAMALSQAINSDDAARHIAYAEHRNVIAVPKSSQILRALGSH